MNFVSRICTQERISGKRVLEIGSYNVNGSARDVIIPYGPCEYVGVDQQEQAGYVDLVLGAEEVAGYFGMESFDVVVSTEMLEHAKDWKGAVESMKSVLKPGGLLVLTARGPGFPIHAYPWDFWRFTTEDISAIFGDFHTLYLSDDVAESPGFLFAGYKTPHCHEANPIPMNLPSPGNVEMPPPSKDGWFSDELPSAFYHVAGIAHWKEIVAEQLGLLKRAGFPGKVHIGFIGQPFEDGFIRRVAETNKLDFEVRHFGSDMAQFEFPTLAWCHEYCQVTQDRPVLYFHGKAVTNTRWQWTMWRWIMNAYNLTQWKTMTTVLRDHNCSGVSWHGNAFPVGYFPGNFWWARASFIREFTEINDYILQFEDCLRHRNPQGFTRRHAAECWINSRMNADPFVAGPAQSRFWDHSWWTDPSSEPWCEMAYAHGH